MMLKTGTKLLIAAALMAYALSFIATSKDYPLDPCYEKIYSWVQKDSLLSRHSRFTLYNDSVIVFADTSVQINWTGTADSMCAILKTQCNKSNSGILVVNAKDTTRAQWDTRYGKKIFYKKCP